MSFARSVTRRYFHATCNGGGRFAPARNLLDLVERGNFHKIFPEPAPDFTQQLDKNSYAAYAGFDATGSSLHIGHLLPLIGLIQVQRTGHQPVAVIGTATTLIGDPSGKSSERELIRIGTVESNAAKLEENIRRVFNNHERLFWPKNSKQKLLPVKILHNGDWLSKWGLVEFLSTVGRHFRIGQMLTRDSVKLRMEGDEGLSLTEFCYQAFQAYDWYYLLSKHDCLFQIGGNDQSGNMYAGYELIRKLSRKETPYFLTLPLITNEAGSKLGKSTGTTLSLDAQNTSEFDLYQHFLRLTDAEVGERLRLFTLMNQDEAQQVLEAHLLKPELRKAQKTVAEHVTRLVHGDEGLQLARECSAVLYDSSDNSAAQLASMHPKQISQSFSNSGFFRELVMEPGTTVKQMAMRVKCFSSEREADRIIRAGGFHVNHRKVANPDAVLILGEHILPNKVSLLRVGKRNYYIVQWLNM